MAGVNPAATIDTANGIAKRVHGDIQDMIPKKGFKFINRVKYDQNTQVGSEFVELVWLTGEHGFTWGGSGGTKRTLNEAEVAISKLATLTPTELWFRSEAVVTLMSRAREKGEKAFEAYVTALMRNAKKAFDKRLEVAMRHGGRPLASATSSVADSATVMTVTFNRKTWAPGIWLNSRNMPTDCYNASTQLNTNAPLHVTIVNMGLRKVTFTGNATDITAIVAAGASADFYYRGSFGLMGTGLNTIANLSTGTYLGINADDFKDVWNGSQVTWDYSTTEFTWAVLHEGLELMADRGFEGDAMVSVPLHVWRQLNASLDALRMLDSSYSVEKQEMGHGIEAISYHAITGRAYIEPSLFDKDGEVTVYPDPSEDGDIIRRIGSSNVTFNVPGRGDEMFNVPDGTNVCEWYAFSDQALWLPSPRSCGVFTA